jgi:hypothetical protein
MYLGEGIWEWENFFVFEGPGAKIGPSLLDEFRRTRAPRIAHPP